MSEFEHYLIQSIGWGFATIVLVNGILIGAIGRVIWSKIDAHGKMLNRHMLKVENRLTRLETKNGIMYEHPDDEN